MNTTDIATDDRRFNEMQLTVIKKAIKLLEDDLFESVTDIHSHEYFNARITYLYLVANVGDNSLFTTRYLRSLHTLFNSYYQSYQSPTHGTEVSDADRERHFLYREVNDVLEDLLCNY